MYSFSISHPTHTSHWWHLGLSRTEKGRKKIKIFDAWPSCSDKILKRFSAHCAVTARQKFCFKIKDWPPPTHTAAIVHLTSSYQLLSLCLTCSLCLLLTLSHRRSHPSAHIFLDVHMCMWEWVTVYDWMDTTWFVRVCDNFVTQFTLSV